MIELKVNTTRGFQFYSNFQIRISLSIPLNLQAFRIEGFVL